MGLPAILGGAGLAMSLFGHKGYGQAQGYMNSEVGALGNENALAGQYGNLAGQGLGNYNADNGNFRSAAGNYAGYLKQDPYTDQRSASAIAGQTAGTSDAYQRARANLQSGLAGAGLGGGASSGLAGGLAGIEAGAAGSMAGAQNQLAQQKLALIPQNMQSLDSLYGGMAGQDYSNATGAMGAQAGLDGNVASGYGNLAQNSIARTDAYNQGLNQTGGSLLGLGGQLYGQQQFLNHPGMFGMGMDTGGGGLGTGVDPMTAAGAGPGSGYGMYQAAPGLLWGQNGFTTNWNTPSVPMGTMGPPGSGF